jgi:hypothetical protein
MGFLLVVVTRRLITPNEPTSMQFLANFPRARPPLPGKALPVREDSGAISSSRSLT